MRAHEILALWDALADKGAFPYGSGGYSEKLCLFELVLSVYKSKSSWALVFEQIGYWYIVPEATNWVRVVRPESEPEQAFGTDYPKTARTMTTDDVTNDPGAEQSDEEVIEEARADGRESLARLQEFRVAIDGVEHVLRPTLDDWRCHAHAEVGPVSFEKNAIAPHLELFQLATQLLRDQMRLHDPCEIAGLSDDYELVFRDDGPDPTAHLGEKPCSPSAVPYWRTLAAFLAGESSTLPSRQNAIDRAIRKALGLDSDQEIPSARLSEITTLNLGDSDATDLVGIERLPNLETLHAFRTSIVDMKPLASLENLREVGFAWTPVADLAPLAGKRALRCVDVSYTRVADLSPLHGALIDDLRVGGSEVRDLAPIANRALRALGIEDTRVADLTPLAELESLKRVWMQGAMVTDTAPIAHLLP